MFEKLVSRGALIAGLAFIAMVIIFVAHFDKTRDQLAENVIVTPAQELRPELVLADTDAGGMAASKQSEETDLAESEPPREVTYEEAEAAFADRNYTKAVDLFTRYTEHKTENPWGFYMLGLSAWKAADHERAEAAFERAIELDSDHVKSYINLSRSLLDAGRPTYALIRVHEALELDPGSGTALRLLGRVNHELGKNDEAIDAYRSAIQTDNEDAWAMNNLALILIEEGRYADALPAMARAVELRNDVAVIYNNLGMALEHAGDFRAASEAYDNALTIDGGYENAYANLTRAAGVVEDPNREPVDLQVAAQTFVEQIAGWGGAVVASDTPEPVESIVPIAVSEPDTTTGGQEQ
jgi:tetratricopeptide (TPR) repeat protein